MNEAEDKESYSKVKPKNTIFMLQEKYNKIQGHFKTPSITKHLEIITEKLDCVSMSMYTYIYI